MTLWEELDLVIRRYVIGEYIAFGYHAKARSLTREYADAAASGLRGRD